MHDNSIPIMRINLFRDIIRICKRQSSTFYFANFISYILNVIINCCTFSQFQFKLANIKLNFLYLFPFLPKIECNNFPNFIFIENLLKFVTIPRFDFRSRADVGFRARSLSPSFSPHSRATPYVPTLCAFNEASLHARVTSTKASVCKSWWNTDVMFDW